MSNETTLFNEEATKKLLKAVVVHNLEDTLDAIKAGADVNAVGADGYTPIVRAMVFPTERLVMSQIIQALLEAGADPNGKGVSPILYASRLMTGNKQLIIQDLFAAGADVNVKDEDGYTPLMSCCDLEFDLVCSMIRKTENINATNIYGQTALMLAIKNTPKDYRAEIVRHLIEAGADATIEDQNGDTALHYAVLYSGSRIKIVKLLLGEEKVDVNAQNNMGLTPIDLAEDSYLDIIKLLTEHGAEDGERRLAELTKEPEETLSHEIPTRERTPAEQIDDVHSELGVSLGSGTLEKIKVKGKTVSFTFNEKVSPEQFAEEVFNYATILMRAKAGDLEDRLLCYGHSDTVDKDEKALKKQIDDLEKSFNSNFSSRAKKGEKAKNSKKKAKKPAKKSKAKPKANAKKSKKK